MSYTLKSAPQLSLGGFETWQMFYSFEGDKHSIEATLELQIKFGFHGDGANDQDKIEDWCRYRFIVNQEGANYQLISDDEWKARCETIREHEDDNAVTEWIQSEVVRCPMIGSGDWQYMHIFKTLVMRWEAMIELGLFRPIISHSDRWPR